MPGMLNDPQRAAVGLARLEEQGSDLCVCSDGDIMPRVQGRPFRCQCGGNVFHREHDAKHGCLIVCNSCEAEYEEVKDV